MSSRFRALVWFVAVSMLLFCAATLMAQATTAEIVGTVIDNTGGVVPNAKVTVKHIATDVTLSMPTNTAGDYDFSLLPIGTYEVSVEATGFKRSVTKDVAITAGDHTRVDVHMEVGQVNESVEVSTQAIALQTDSSTVGA